MTVRDFGRNDGERRGREGGEIAGMPQFSKGVIRTRRGPQRCAADPGPPSGESALSGRRSRLSLVLGRDDGEGARPGWAARKPIGENRRDPQEHRVREEWGPGIAAAGSRGTTSWIAPFIPLLKPDDVTTIHKTKKFALFLFSGPDRHGGCSRPLHFYWGILTTWSVHSAQPFSQPASSPPPPARHRPSACPWRRRDR